jgi:acetyl esterase
MKSISKYLCLISMVCLLCSATPGKSALLTPQPAGDTTYTQPGKQLVATAKKVLYKKTPQENMYLYILYPQNKSDKPLPAIIYYTGGGWLNGDVADEIPTAAWFRDHGMIGITADYRVKNRHNTTPMEAINDARSAMRYIRGHAKELGIDPQKIVAAGGSAGGHLAICTFLDGGDDPADDLSISTKPNGLVLHNPVLGEGYGAYFLDKHPEFTPLNKVGANWPPTIVSCGTKDGTTPYSGAVKFTQLMQEKDNTCELITVNDADHSCDWPVSNPNFLPTLTRMVNFLGEQHLLSVR